jgi:acetylornithine/N-succinyldiaminopimelate aminotransferase
VESMKYPTGAEKLIAAALEMDPRIHRAKQLIHEAVADHKKKITGVKPPQHELKTSYEAILSRFSEERGGKTWFPYLGSGVGNGALVELLDGSVKYDFITGIGVHSFGHSYLPFVEATVEASLSNTVMQGHLQQNMDSVQLTDLLIQLSKLQHCFLSTSGVMANENGLKIAFQKRAPATRVLSFEKCFMGRTLATSQITDKPSFRDGLPPTLVVDYVPFYDAARPQESTKEALDALQRHLNHYPHQHAVMCFELVLGEGGFYPGSREFFTQIMTVLKEKEIAILVDEVQTFGRTPELFAFQYFGLEQFVDIVTIGKMSQVCATLFKHEYQPRPGLLSQTFTGSSASIRCGKILIETLVKGGFYGPSGKITQLHHHFIKRLEAMHEKYPHAVNGPYGIGGMIAFTPFDGEEKRVTKFVHDLFHTGVMGFIAGTNPTRIRFLMPIGVVTFDDIDNVCSIIETVITQSS